MSEIPGQHIEETRAGWLIVRGTSSIDLKALKNPQTMDRTHYIGLPANQIDVLSGRGQMLGIVESYPRYDVDYVGPGTWYLDELGVQGEVSISDSDSRMTYEIKRTPSYIEEDPLVARFYTVKELDNEGEPIRERIVKWSMRNLKIRVPHNGTIRIGSREVAIITQDQLQVLPPAHWS